MPDIFLDVDTALAGVPVNIMPLIDDTDFKTREVAIAYDAAGMDLVWNFVTSAGAMTQTTVTPTAAGVYDWINLGGGMYSIEMPASGGASINNDTEGYGWFTGICTGVLPWRGPTIGFRRAALNDLFVDGGTASDNLEDFFDGTGYVGGAIPLGVDVVAISGDSVASDNLETMLDGTGGNKLSLSQINIVASGDDSAIVASGSGTGHGVALTGGGTGNGLNSLGGATSGTGIAASSPTQGYGMSIAGGGSASGLYVVGAGAGHGMFMLGGAGGGDGTRFWAQGGSGNGVYFYGFGSGVGMRVFGGATGQGALFSGGASGARGLQITGTVGNDGFYSAGNGAGSGMRLVAGASASGLYASNLLGQHFVKLADAANGMGMVVSSTSGNGLKISGGTNSDAMLLLGNGTGAGLSATGGATDADGIKATGGGNGHGMELHRGSSDGGNDFYLTHAATNIPSPTLQNIRDAMKLAPTAGVPDAGSIDEHLDFLDADFTTPLADSVPADGAFPTIPLALYMITQYLFEREVVGATLTIKKPDGATALMTITLNDATSPTAHTRTA